jgi:hypothetical protein
VNYSVYKSNLGYLILIALFIKLMAFGLSLSDCLGALVLLSFAFGSKVLEYYVPARPDIYADLKSMQDSMTELVSKTDELERDVMGIKLGVKR